MEVATEISVAMVVEVTVAMENVKFKMSNGSGNVNFNGNGNGNGNEWQVPSLYDKIRPYYVRRKDTKDTVGRYIVLIPEVKADSCQHDSK